MPGPPDLDTELSHEQAVFSAHGHQQHHQHDDGITAVRHFMLTIPSMKYECVNAQTWLHDAGAKGGMFSCSTG